MSMRKETDERDGLDFEGILGDREHDELRDPGLKLPFQGTQDEIVNQLQNCAMSFTAPMVDFKSGDLVQWKKNMKNKRRPDYGTPMIVIEVLEEPIYDAEKDSGSAYFKESLTVKAGSLDNDGDFLVFHYDGRRFEPFKTE